MPNLVGSCRFEGRSESSNVLFSTQDSCSTAQAVLSESVESNPFAFVPTAAKLTMHTSSVSVALFY
ncbi:hypothetical protein TWF696_007833 [Orbilia brochopaga]|uniref:Uncharacterized protein n=1 Tax=Orbilia brochopaga TaxID=3140254 RepID=A0AAV9UQ35_9PEZI